MNWTGWGTYLITGLLQGALLILCLSFKVRQKKLGIDDWGVPLPESQVGGSGQNVDERSRLLR